MKSFQRIFLLQMVMLLTIGATAYCGETNDYLTSGIEKKSKGDFDGAAADFTKAIELNSGNAMAYINRGIIKKDNRDSAGAVADFTKAVEIRSDYVIAYVYRGTIKNDTGDLDGAIADFTKAIELKPDYAEAFYRRGTVKQRKLDRNGSIADLTKAIELKPDYANAYHVRGLNKRMINDSDGAIADLTKASELDPGNSSHASMLGFTKEMKRLQEKVKAEKLLGGSLFIGGVAPIHAQESISPLERCSRILKFGELQGNGAPTKVEAVHALGLLGDPRAIPLLVEHLGNEANNHLRLQIVRALGWIGSDAAIPALEKSLKDQYPYVREQAAAALKKITGKEFEFDRTGLTDPAKLREMLEKAREERKKG